MHPGNENEERTGLSTFKDMWSSNGITVWQLSKLYFHERIGKCVEEHRHRRGNIRVRRIPASTDHGNTACTSHTYPEREATYWQSRMRLIMVCHKRTFGINTSGICADITEPSMNTKELNMKLDLGSHGFIWSSDFPEQAKLVGVHEMHQMLIGNVELEQILNGGMDTMDTAMSSLMNSMDGSDLIPFFDCATGTLTWSNVKEELENSSQEESLSQAIEIGENGTQESLIYQHWSEESENSELS